MTWTWIWIVVVACSGCLTVSARVHGGPTVDTGGEVGWEIGASAGLGYSLSPRTSVRSLPQVSIGDRGAAFGTSLELGRLGPRLGWHAGIALALEADDDARQWVYGAAMRPLLFDRNTSSENRKFSFLDETTRALQVGVEARARVDGVFALLPVVDWTMTIAD